MAKASYQEYSQRASEVIAGLSSNYQQTGDYKNHFYSLKNQSKKALVVVSGVAEPVIKYWQIIDFFKANYDLYYWDHLGQGKSAPILPQINSKKIHIDSFKTYDQTLKPFLAHLRPKYEKIHILSHSMGSHIILRQIASQSQLIDKFVAIAPMIDIKTGFIPKSVARFFLKTFYKPFDWAPFQSDQSPKAFFFTSATENFENYQKYFKQKYPKQLSTGVTAGWLLQSLLSIEKINQWDKSQLVVPSQFFTAGKDYIVSSKAAQKFCSDLPDCQSIHYPKGKHQLLIENESIRKDLFAKIKSFLATTE